MRHYHRDFLRQIVERILQWFDDKMDTGTPRRKYQPVPIRTDNQRPLPKTDFENEDRMLRYFTYAGLILLVLLTLGKIASGADLALAEVMSTSCKFQQGPAYG